MVDVVLPMHVCVLIYIYIYIYFIIIYLFVILCIANLIVYACVNGKDGPLKITM